MAMRGIRGATVVEQDSPQAILQATAELLEAILQANPTLRLQDIGSAFFTVTDDLQAAYPALAARQLGWTRVPLMCAREIPIPGGLPRCIRVLLHWNTECSQDEVQHIYLREAARLRPDLSAQE